MSKPLERAPRRLEGVPWSVETDGLLLDVRLTPRSSKDAVEGVDHLSDGRAVLKARVRAIPEDGRANAALCRLIATSLEVAASRVMISSGATARIKRVKVNGDPQALVVRLEACLAALDRQGHLKAL